MSYIYAQLAHFSNSVLSKATHIVKSKFVWGITACVPSKCPFLLTFALPNELAFCSPLLWHLHKSPSPDENGFLYPCLEVTAGQCWKKNKHFLWGLLWSLEWREIPNKVLRAPIEVRIVWFCLRKIPAKLMRRSEFSVEIVVDQVLTQSCGKELFLQESLVAFFTFTLKAVSQRRFGCFSETSVLPWVF